MEIENIHVYGFVLAITRGMRNPKNSWDQSDSEFICDADEVPYVLDGEFGPVTCMEMPLLGLKDLNLACRLVKAGSDHRKFMRQIYLGFDISVARYIWQELDTYKVGTVRNSCSTMHKLGHRDLVPDDFQDCDIRLDCLNEQNDMGKCYREHSIYTDHAWKHSYKGVVLLSHMKRRLPEGFLQRATFTANYEWALSVLQSQRRTHRMKEWSGPGGICEMLLSLPYMREFDEAVWL